MRFGKQRSKGNASGASDERETILNQLLVEMDGFDSTNYVVVLIPAELIFWIRR